MTEILIKLFMTEIERLSDANRTTAKAVSRTTSNQIKLTVNLILEGIKHLIDN